MFLIHFLYTYVICKYFYLSQENSVEFKRPTGVKICSDRFRDVLISIFEFYADFDFHRYIISVFYGKSIDRLHDTQEIKENLKYFRNNDALAIQDIFRLNKNVSNTITIQNIEQFQQICRTSGKFLNESGNSLRY